MTYAGCKESKNPELVKVKGVLYYKTSYAAKRKHY